ncbi:MAG TPA: AsmA-like C-terminal region-containing protein [Terriglobales bacterium]|nr:AsmA-like C-terminal region-containing protein [Terriglobales bacterium]
MAAQVPLQLRRRFPIPGWLLVATITVILAISAFALLVRHWPFTESAVVQSLEAASSSKVRIGSFRSLYFPHPGCVARDVAFVHDPGSNGPPLITIRQLAVQSSFLGMLRHHVRTLRIDGMQIQIPRQTDEKFKSTSKFVIDELIANKATLIFPRAEKKPLEFSIHWGRLRNVGGSGAMLFEVRLSNPEPPGEIEASGSFGPWNGADAGHTPLSGHYIFQRADLSIFHGIAGLLSSRGDFEGTLEHIAVQGSADTRNFTVTSSRHKADLKNQFQAVVNATTGETQLQRVDSQFRRTHLVSTGIVAKHEGTHGTLTTLNVCSKAGRIQDLLLLFTKADRSPMTGSTSFCANVSLPAQERPFLRQVELEGDFGIDTGSFTTPQTQENVNKLSAESRDQDDHDPGTVLSGLKGHVKLIDGIATFTDLSFSIPGAFAQMQGTYDVISHQVDLHGTLKMDASLSHTAHGAKALIMKFMEPFFKRKPQGSVVPVKLTGTYEMPSFGLDLNGQKENRTSKRLQQLYATSSH